MEDKRLDEAGQLGQLRKSSTYVWEFQGEQRIQKGINHHTKEKFPGQKGLEASDWIWLSI